MITRRERPADVARSRSIQAEAFARSDQEPIEARLLDELRVCEGWIPELSWVAELGGQIVGHNVCTRGYVNDVACVGLGPIGVRSASQRSGVGLALMHSMIGAADALGEPLIALLGDPTYYSRYGFVASVDLGIDPPDEAWGVYFQVRPLSAWSDTISGRFRYSEPFDRVS